jgi:hypothetical protein
LKKRKHGLLGKEGRKLHRLIYSPCFNLYYFIVLSYKVRPYPEPFLFYFCKSDYFTLYKHVYTKKTCFPKFFSIFFTKERKFTTKGKTNARGLREEFFSGRGGRNGEFPVGYKSNKDLGEGGWNGVIFQA